MKKTENFASKDMVNKSYGTNSCYLWESYFLRDTGTAVVQNSLSKLLCFFWLVEGPVLNDIQARFMEGLYPPQKLTWLAGKSTMNEDVFPIEQRGFSSLSC